MHTRADGVVFLDVCSWTSSSSSSSAAVAICLLYGGVEMYVLGRSLLGIAQFNTYTQKRAEWM